MFSTLGSQMCMRRSLDPFPWIKIILFCKSMFCNKIEQSSEILIPVAKSNSSTAISRSVFRFWHGLVVLWYFAYAALNSTSNVLRGFISNISGVDIFVYEDEYEKAIKLLEQNQMIPEQLKYCPFCHSSNIQFVLKKKNKLRAIVSTILAMLAGASPGTEHWEYICKQCGKHFDKPVAWKKWQIPTNIWK